jgi:hypothetical protein
MLQYKVFLFIKKGYVGVVFLIIAQFVNFIKNKVMKFFALFLSLTFSTMVFSNSIVESLELKPDFRIEVDVFVSLGGCDYHVTGWIDASYNIMNGSFSINSFNLNVQGSYFPDQEGCGDHVVTGMIALPPEDDPNVEVDENTLTEIVTKILSENLE